MRTFEERREEFVRRLTWLSKELGVAIEYAIAPWLIDSEPGYYTYENNELEWFTVLGGQFDV